MRRVWTYSCRGLGLLSVAIVVSALAPVVAAEEKPAAKAIDLVICLDTSGSMRGLIDSAKVKLWDIVNEMAKAKPTPNLRVSLYSYGNDGYDAKNGWVRKEADFTTDLDLINQKLFGLTINGGTEYATRVCRDAIHEQKWSEDKGALKLIFVCGNEPATQDPLTPTKEVAEKAVRAGIIINTIYCGSPAHAEAKGWKEFADLSEGRFASIDMSRGTVAISTPYDKELATLGAQFNLTCCWCGKEAKVLAENQVRQDANAAQLGTGVAAARSVSKGSGVYKFEANDLVEKLKADPKFDVKKVPADELPDDLKKMTPEEREKHVKEQLAKREEIQKRIVDLSKQRDTYIQEETKKNPNAGEKAFDEAVRGMVREQAQKKGIEIK